MLNKIRECARAALMDGEAVAGKLTDTCEAEQKGQREALERSLTKDEERIDVLEKMVLRLYEDMVAGRISEANFNLLMEKTQKEQAELKAKVEMCIRDRLYTATIHRSSRCVASCRKPLAGSR